jgi:type I restriction enzyme S subunit
MKVDSWRSISLGDITSVVTSGSRDWAKHYSDSGSKFIRMTNLPRDGIYLKLNDMKYVDVKSNSADGKRTSLIHGDILISITAELGKIGWIPEGFGEAYINQHTALVRIKKAEAESKFVAYLLSSDMINRIINLGNDSGAKAGLNLPSVKSVPICIPPLPEQQKIAAILTSVDEVIEKTQAQIDKLKDLKTAMMQELLTQGVGVDGKPHLEFKDSPVGRVPEGWDILTVGDLGSEEKYAIVDGPFGSSINTKRDYINEGIPVIRTVNIRPFKFIENRLKFVSEEVFETVKRSAVYPGDVLLSKVGTIGYSCIFPNHIEKAILSTTGSCKLTVNSEIISPLFLCYSLNHLKPFMDLIASEGVQPFLNMNTIKSFLIKIPTLTEQQKIVDIMESISKKMNTVETKLASVKNIKKALMQDLLTGKVRVKLDSRQQLA